MFRKPLFWLAFTLAVAASVAFAARFFGTAFPIITLDLRMDRAAAFARAEALAERHGWGPGGFRQAASFGQEDPDVQPYVELEAGGSEAFIEMQNDGLFQAYTWQVRHFRQHDEHEAFIRFTPEGEPYGFELTFPESEKGASLGQGEARSIAELGARAWSIDLDVYTLIEASREVRPGGRTDHTFVYERPEDRVGEAKFRLRLGVAGDRLSELTHFVHVPEAFEREYAELRSTNDVIAFASMLGAGLLFLVGGCGFGVFYLLRHRWILWRRALVWGIAVGVAVTLAGLNGLPLEWMDYDTALSERAFLVRYLLALVGGLVFTSAFFTLVFLTAESLSRRAFPHHLQQWRLWSRDVGGSDDVLGRTLGGYLWSGFDIAYAVGFYLIARRLLGWWTPSEALVSPDLLATYMPWVTSVGTSLYAGFVEESLFRAIPLAGAALMGQRFGRPRAWVVGVLLLQALVFAAGHANYPGQPAYSRVVELFIPSVIFGLIFLRFGLLPVVVAHYAYDLAWFALPLFVSAAPGIWVDRTMVVALGLLPLWIVLAARLRSGAREAPVEAYNAAWQPPALPVAEPVAEPERVPLPEPVAAGDVAYAAPAPGRGRRVWMVPAALVGLALWGSFGERSGDAPRLELSRTEAVERARAVLAERGRTLGPEWRALTSLDDQRSEADRFVWRTGGEEAYRSLQASYADPPHWHVRFVRFEGPVADRAEEYEVRLAPDGRLLEYEHTLPEARPGKSLTEDEARAAARAHIVASLGLDAARLREVSAEPTKRPARTDWELTWADTAGYRLASGEGRVEVVIAGDEVAGARRYVHVPEEWSRAEKARRNPLNIVGIVGGALFGLAYLAALIVAIVAWSRGRFSVRAFTNLFLVAAALILVLGLNDWPSAVSTFRTEQPYSHQLFIMLAIGGLVPLVVGAASGLLGGLIHHRRWPQPAPAGSVLATGLAAGLLLVGFDTVVKAFAPSLAPAFPRLDPAAGFLPLVGAGLGPAGGLLYETLLYLAAILVLDRLSDGWTRRKGWTVGAALFLGLTVAAADGPEMLGYWAVSGLYAGVAVLAVFGLVLRTHLAVVPVVTAVGVVMEQAETAIVRPFDGSLPGALLAALVVVAGAVVWSGVLLRPARAPGGGAEVAPGDGQTAEVPAGPVGPVASSPREV